MSPKLSAPSLELKEGMTVSVNSWFIEIQKTFKQYNVCFIHKIEDKRENLLDRSYLNYNNIFKGFYNTNPESPSDLKRFILLNIPSGKSKLIELMNHKVIFGDINLDILISDGVLNSRYSFIYFFQIEELKELYSKIEFKRIPHFLFKDKKLPIPSLPISKIPEFSPSRFDLYTSYVSRSFILCIFISSELSISLFGSENTDTNTDEDKLIAISDKFFVERSYSIYEDKRVSVSPYKILVYPYDSQLSVPGFLNELPDHDSFVFEESHNQLQQSDFYTEGEFDEYSSYWDMLDTSEKFEEDEALAERYFSEGEYFVNDLREFESNEDYFQSKRKIAENLFSKLICTYIDKDFIIFEVLKYGGYQHSICPIILNPLVKGIHSYSGILSISNLGDFSFCIVEKCPKIF